MRKFGIFLAFLVLLKIANIDYVYMHVCKKQVNFIIGFNAEMHHPKK